MPRTPPIVQIARKLQRAKQWRRTRPLFWRAPAGGRPRPRRGPERPLLPAQKAPAQRRQIGVPQPVLGAVARVGPAVSAEGGTRPDPTARGAGGGPAGGGGTLC